MTAKFRVVRKRNAVPYLQLRWRWQGRRREAYLGPLQPDFHEVPPLPTDLVALVVGRLVRLDAASEDPVQQDRYLSMLEALQEMDLSWETLYSILG